MSLIILDMIYENHFINASSKKSINRVSQYSLNILDEIISLIFHVMLKSAIP